MKLSSQTIADLARKAAAAASGPATVMLFGSYARDEAHEDSDLDLLVIEPGLSNPAEEYLRLRSAIGRIGVGVDLLLYSTTEFIKRSNIPGTLLYSAAREGKVLHERPA